MQCIELNNLDVTEKIGVTIGRLALPGDVICLYGDLGAGKTTFTKSIARGLEVVEPQYVVSPTFTIFCDYPGRIPLYHFDFYRLQDGAEIVDLGFEEYIYNKGLSVIEWPERAEDYLPVDSLKLSLTFVTEKSRKLCFTSVSDLWQDRVAEIVSLLRK